MGLLENEKWDDYIDKEVYVTSNDGTSGFLGHLRGYDYTTATVEDPHGNAHEIPHEHVYGTWVLEDW